MLFDKYFLRYISSLLEHKFSDKSPFQAIKCLDLYLNTESTHNDN